jgi:drug/metabolite transporter (DMT)-like permease
MPAVLVLALALVGISFAGPLVRLSNAHPLTIAIWRLGFALIFIVAALVVSGTWRQWARLRQREVWLAVGTGVMLALHFWTWNASISMTTVAASVVLVNIHPALVAMLSATWLREPPSTRQWAGIAVAMVGGFVVALPDLIAATDAISGRALLGDLLALAGGATAACYVVAGRRLRSVLNIWPYVAIVYGTCFVVLLCFAAAVNAPVLGQPPRELWIFAALAIGPMLLGHTGLNWALRYLPAYVVNLVLLGEPIGATLIALVMPGIEEVPSGATLAGGALVLAGIYLAMRVAKPSLLAADAKRQTEPHPGALPD